jgi:hypothetical protein
VQQLGGVGKLPSLVACTELDDYLWASWDRTSQKEVAMERPGSLDRFPDGWTDPLDLYGEHLQDLLSVGCNVEAERGMLKELVEKYGAIWVWCNRHRLVPLAIALRNYPRR